MKKRYLILCIALWIGVLGIVPLNLFLISMSDIVIYLAVAAVITGLIAFILRANSRRLGKIVISVLSILVIAAFVMCGYVCNPYWNSTFRHSDPVPASLAYDEVMTSKEAMEDLEYAVKYLKKLHPACYGGLPADIEQRYSEVKAKISSCDGITVNELSRDIESIFSLLHDAHTCTSINDINDRYIKYAYEWDGEGYSITAVNGISIADLLIRNSDIYSFECESWELKDLSNDIISVSGLDYLGFDINEGITYTLTNEEGEMREVICRDEDYLTVPEYYAYNDIEQDTEDEEAFVDYEIDEEHSLAILNLYECNFNDEYKQVVHDMFTEVKEKNIQNVAVDVRHNGGGNDAVVTWFFRYLDIDEYRVSTCEWRLGPFMIDCGDGIYQNERIEDLTFRGNLYVLSTANSFSSAMEFAEFVRDNDLGTIIGEAPGNDPDSYGDVAYFSLPNSHIFMQISTKNWVRADRNAPAGLIIPDIECDITHYEDSREALYNAISEDR